MPPKEKNQGYFKDTEKKKDDSQSKAFLRYFKGILDF
jgi:hypothetical protein